MEYDPAQGRCSNPVSGFSLTELMVGLALMAILSMLALPSVIELIARQNAESFVQQFRQQLSYARVQAVSLGGPVTVCPRQSQLCDGRWSETPVQIFNSAASQDVLKQLDALRPDHRLYYNRELLEFRADGSLNALQNGTFIYCVAQYHWHASLSISQSGRSQLEWHEQPCPY